MRHFAIVILAAGALGSLAARPAHCVSVGGAAFGGPSIPIAQEDNSTGAQFGIRVPVGVLSLLSVEPYFAYSSLGDASETFAGAEYTRSGYSVDAFGINVALGSFGLVPGFFPYVGIGSHSLSRDGSEDETDVGYNVGVGFGFGIPMSLSVNVRGELNVVDVGDTSRKFINATASVGYKFLGLP
jgi:hypothetical protein